MYVCCVGNFQCHHLHLQLPAGNKNYMNALWGKLASEILMQNWDPALEDLNRLKEVIDNNVSSDFLLIVSHHLTCVSHFLWCLLPFQTMVSSLQSLQQRTWLIHWSLFVFFNHPKGRDLIIDLFLYQPL